MFAYNLVPRDANLNEVENLTQNQSSYFLKEALVVL